MHTARVFEWKQVRFALIDYFALTLVHGLLLIGFFRLVQDDSLDPEVKLPKRAASHQKKPQLRRKPQNEHPSKRGIDEAGNHPSKGADT